jgi:ADP-ribose pyrophosphatase
MENFSLIESKVVFEGKVVKLLLDRVQLPNGHETELEVVKHRGAVGIVPLDEDIHVYLVRQYRHATGEELLEIPAGKLSPGENPRECAVRELEEEVGVKASKWTHLCSFYTSPGFTDEMLYLYLAQGIYPGEASPEEDEHLKVLRLPLKKAAEMVLKGEIKDAKTIVGIVMVMLFHSKLGGHRGKEKG